MSSVESSFSKSANSYDNFSDIQRQIADNLVNMLPASINPSTIIDLGAGTGYLAYKISKIFPQAEITLCDISDEMLKVAKSKIPSAQLLCSNFENINDINKYDLVISSAALHWSQSFELVLKVLKSITKDKLLISLMLDGTLVELRSIREEIVPNKKAKPKLQTFDYYNNLLTNNFEILDACHHSYTQYYTTVDEVMDSLKKTGVNGGNSEKLNKEEYRKLIQIYTNRYKSEKGFPLSYKAAFFIANIKARD